MDNKTYFKVGLFVILGALLFVVAVVLFGGGKFFKEKYTIETYFDQSVQGLDVGAPLKFNGVQIGNVSEIHFVFNDYQTYKQYVLVRAEVLTDSVRGGGGRRIADEYEHIGVFLDELVEKGLRLELASQGVTGLAFLNMIYEEPENFPPFDIDWEPKYPYIPSTPGTITLIAEAIEDISKAVNEINFKEIGANLEDLLLNLSEIDYSEIEYRLQEVLGTLEEAMVSLNDTSKGIRRFTVTEKTEIQDIIRDLKVISEHVRQIAGTGKREPGWFLFGSPPPRVNPGER